MIFERCYRLKLSNLGELSKFMSGHRAHSLRLMMSMYSESVAKVAVNALDQYSLGLRDAEADFLSYATVVRQSALSKSHDGIFAPALNCVVNYYFVGPAILACMRHGNERYKKSFEGRREVVKWGWMPDMQRPYHISEIAWDERRKYWEQVSKLSYERFGHFEFRLIGEELPKIGWNTISKSLPAFEWRVQQAVKSLVASDGADAQKLSESQRKRYLERATRSLKPELDRKSFEIKPVSRAASGKAESAGKKERKSEDDDRPAPLVDHADIVVASDGRAFLAIPYVAFRPEDRIFIQIGSRDISFSQMGIQYGTVSNIPSTSRDYLRGLTSITVVEVQEINGKRLLRAKHTAMVSDISVGEGLRKPLHTFKAKPRERGFEEI